MSMLKYFLDIGTDKSLFDGLEISRETELCEKYMGQYPVISITLKNINAGNFEASRLMITRAINEEARRFQFLLDSDRLSKQDKRDFENAQFEQECKKALKQIDDNDYTAELKNDGMRILLKYGVACYKSKCKVAVEREEHDPK